MSVPGKVEYGGAPSTFNLQCIKGLDPQTAQYIADQFNQINEALYLLGNPHRVQDGASVPPTQPARNKVRFELTSNMVSKSATAQAVDGNGDPIAGAPTFTVHDPMDRYSSAGTGDFGIASYVEYPDSTYRFEVDVIGGEGTVTGTANDEKVKVTSDDTTEKHLYDAIYNNNGSSPVAATVVSGAALPAGYQEVFVQEVTDTPNNEKARFVTSSASATDNYTVKVSSSDTGPNFLEESVATTPQNYVDSGAFNGDNHQKVYFVVEGSGDEKFSLRTKRSEDTGKVKVSTADTTLEYLYEKFDDVDTYDATQHLLVYNDDTGAPRSNMRLFTPSTLCAKITAQIPARSDDDYGQGTADLGYITSLGAWTAIVDFDDVTVWNPAAVTINVPSNLTSIHIPVSKVNGEWVLQGVFDPYQLSGWTYDSDQSIGHDESDVPEWQDDSSCPA